LVNIPAAIPVLAADLQHALMLAELHANIGLTGRAIFGEIVVQLLHARAAKDKLGVESHRLCAPVSVRVWKKRRIHPRFASPSLHLSQRENHIATQRTTLNAQRQVLGVHLRILVASDLNQVAHIAIALEHALKHGANRLVGVLDAR
jgi:hypothetical protein